MQRAAWVKKNRKRKLTGNWKFVWSADAFLIQLDQRDPITGLKREFYTHENKPEFNGWKIENDVH